MKYVSCKKLSKLSLSIAAGLVVASCNLADLNSNGSSNNLATAGNEAPGYQESMVWISGAADHLKTWGTNEATVAVPNVYLGNPTRVYADENDGLYVIDGTGGRIMKFNAATSEFIGWIGGIQSPPTEGGLNLGNKQKCRDSAVATFAPAWCRGGASGNGYLATLPFVGRGGLTPGLTGLFCGLLNVAVPVPDGAVGAGLGQGQVSQSS